MNKASAFQRRRHVLMMKCGTKCLGTRSECEECVTGSGLAKMWGASSELPHGERTGTEGKLTRQRRASAQDVAPGPVRRPEEVTQRSEGEGQETGWGGKESQGSRGLHTHLTGLVLGLRALEKAPEILQKLRDAGIGLKPTGWVTEQDGVEMGVERPLGDKHINRGGGASQSKLGGGTGHRERYKERDGDRDWLGECGRQVCRSRGDGHSRLLGKESWVCFGACQGHGACRTSAAACSAS